jgi:biopolymer transport protein ExbB
MGAVQAQEDASSMDELLQQIERGQARDSAEARQREQRFAQARNEQQNLLNQARQERARQERNSERLEQLFEDQQNQIIAARQALDERLGALKELFGVLQTVAGDAQGRFSESLTSIQYPDREGFLVELGSKMASATALASIEEIERLWFELQREVTESGRIVKFNHQITTAAGDVVAADVVRVGAFNIVFEDGYLQFNSNTGSVSELTRQPEQSRFTNSTYDMVHQAESPVTFGLDGTRGSILALLVESPTIGDRIQQGGIVGYCIIGLGIVGLLIALFRAIGLSTAGRKVAAQLKRDSASTDNPLGRVLAAYEANRGADTETIELKLSEAALKEMPDLTKGLLFIKVISVVAPLMGLLGTVTGMIKTFQVITLFGAGDPKMMAGGISQALMTTVLGLCVAIPMVLIHTLVSGQSRKIIIDSIEAIRDFMELGGPVLRWIAVTIFLMWVLIIERIVFFRKPMKDMARDIHDTWESRSERKSWNAHQIREQMISQFQMATSQGIAMIQTLVALCPLLGLLGTVTGMIKVFGVMAVSGSGNVRAMAAGVSQATVPTMAGMVGALSGVLLVTLLSRRAAREVEFLEDSLTMDH